jgi:hypothetical protein
MAENYRGFLPLPRRAGHHYCSEDAAKTLNTLLVPRAGTTLGHAVLSLHLRVGLFVVFLPAYAVGGSLTATVCSH